MDNQRRCNWAAMFLPDGLFQPFDDKFITTDNDFDARRREKNILPARDGFSNIFQQLQFFTFHRKL